MKNTLDMLLLHEINFIQVHLAQFNQHCVMNFYIHEGSDVFTDTWA